MKSNGAHTGALVTDRRTLIHTKENRRDDVMSTDGDAPGTDGAQLLWIATPWSDCSVECGNGTQTRMVTCVNNETQAVVGDDVCLADTFVIPSVRPVDQKPCVGDCVKCEDQDILFRSIGLTSPPPAPVPSHGGKICAVSDPKYSCCDANVENSIVTQVIAIRKGFEKLPSKALEAEAKAMEELTNSTNAFSARFKETQTSLSLVESAMERTIGLKGFDVKVSRSLKSLKDILEQRLVDLQSAVDNSTAIVAFIKEQLGVIGNDKSMLNETFASTTTNSIINATKQPTLVDCAQATADMFSAMSCAACNPAFIKQSLDVNDEDGLISNVNVSTSVCVGLYNQCVPTIRESRRYLRRALSVMRKIHSRLTRSVARTQPVILALWSTIVFDWLPGSTRPLASFKSGEVGETYAPDITSLDCIKNSKLVLKPATQVNEFCNTFFDEWNYHSTIKSILTDVDSGVVAYQSLERCDMCVHTILTKLSEIFANNGGSLDVALDLNPAALAQAGCFGMSSTPAKKYTPPPIVVNSVTIPIPQNWNFFALQPGEVWKSGSDISEIQRKSSRAISLILSASKLTSSRKRYHTKSFVADALTNSDIAPIALNQDNLIIPSLNFSDEGIDPLVLANVSWDAIRDAINNPPPPQWALRTSAEVGIVASTMNCTSHGACNPDSGDSPYWFCATVKVCNGDIPCDDTERALLESHSRCVKGLCVDDRTAVDGKCPDIATCPVTADGRFDHSYFSRFKSIAPMSPPSRDEVETDGVEAAVAKVQISQYANGVCDCAFSKETDRNGQVNLVVGDKCKYAQCLAYAQSVEGSLSCQGGLGKRCQDFVHQCPDLDCDKTGALWNVPMCTVTNPADGSSFAQATEGSDATTATVTTVITVLTILALTV